MTMHISSRLACGHSATALRAVLVLFPLLLALLHNHYKCSTTILHTILANTDIPRTLLHCTQLANKLFQQITASQKRAALAAASIAQDSNSSGVDSALEQLHSKFREKVAASINAGPHELLRAFRRVTRKQVTVSLCNGCLCNCNFQV
jgi:uncharacterized alpha-E superfamily protein